MSVLKLFDLSGRNALVTGGSYGLGRAMAEALLEAGADLGLIDVSDKLADTARELSASGR